MQIRTMVVLNDMHRRLVKVMRMFGADDAASAVSPADLSRHTRWKATRVDEELRKLADQHIVRRTLSEDGGRYYLVPRTAGTPTPVGAGRIPPW
jgi:nitric oxide reductase activation protein